MPPDRPSAAPEARRTQSPRGAPTYSIAVIGGGIAGAAAARGLVNAGHRVTVFDKGRRAGGRTNTRREDGRAFDHGAQYFTARDERFARVARDLCNEGVLAAWHGPIEILGPPSEAALRIRDSKQTRFVAVPGMSALVERLLGGIDARFGVHVTRVSRDGEQWRLDDASGVGLGLYDIAVVAVPAPQAAALIAPTLPTLAARLEPVIMAPCWAGMAELEGESAVTWSAAVSTTGPLSWIAREVSKPGRTGASWVMHASPAWSRANIEASPESVMPQLLDAFFAATGIARRAAVFAKAHRWRYAKTETPLGYDCVWEPAARLAVCGDWCLGARIESAFLSGCAAAERINAVGPTGAWSAA